MTRLLAAALAALILLIAETSTAQRAPDPSALVDQSTPRQAVAGLIREVTEGRANEASRFLDLRGMRWGRLQPHEAATLLVSVLKRRVWIDLGNISDAPEGDPSDGADTDRIATVDVDGLETPLTVARIQRGGLEVWVVSATTVAAIPSLASTLGATTWATRVVPAEWQDRQWLGLWSWQWAGLAIALLVVFPLGWFFAKAVLTLAARLAARSSFTWDGALVSAARRTMRFGLGWLAMTLAVSSLDFPAQLMARITPWLNIPIVVAVGWFLIDGFGTVTDLYLETVPDDQELNTRGLRTQIVLLRKIGAVAVVLITLAIALMQFELVRSVGWSLLASAGVAGVALGFAAQKSLGAVVAGLQLSITQPIRLGDVITIFGQWGQVEEIALTYVRVRLFDDRRLVVPIGKFLGEPFENWSKPGDSLVGIVELAVDPTTPVDAVRAELERLAEDVDLHDGRECVVQVIDLSEHRMLLRCRVSCDRIDGVFAMRCALREKLVTFLQELEGGRYLAHQRHQRIASA